MAGEPHILAVGSGSPPVGSEDVEGMEKSVIPVGQQFVSMISIGGLDVSMSSAAVCAATRA